MRVILSTFFFMGLVFQTFAQNNSQERTTFSLNEAIDYALEKSFTVRNSSLQKNLSIAKKREVTAMMLPQVSGNADFNHSFQVQKIILESGVIPIVSGHPYGTPVPLQLSLRNQLTPSLSASQIIFDKGYFSSIGAAKVSEEIADKNIKKSKIDISVNVTKAYYAVLVNEKQLKSIEANLARLDSSYKEAKARYESGLARRIDVSRIEVSVNNMKEEREKVSRSLELSRNVLRYQMNADDANPLVLTDSLHEGLVKDAEQVLVQKQEGSYSKRIEYSIIQSQLLLSKYDLKATRANHYPRLTAVASAGYTPSASKISDLAQSARWYPFSLVGLRLHVPIFSGNSIHYQVQQKKIEEEMLENNKQALEKGINLEVEQALINLHNSIESIKLQKRNLELADENLQVLRAEYEQGIALNIEVTTAEASLIEAQTNYYNALYSALVSKVEYDKAMGNINK
jgi:outer membrane protein TolC